MTFQVNCMQSLLVMSWPNNRKTSIQLISWGSPSRSYKLLNNLINLELKKKGIGFAWKASRMLSRTIRWSMDSRYNWIRLLKIRTIFWPSIFGASCPARLRWLMLRSVFNGLRFTESFTSTSHQSSPYTNWKRADKQVSNYHSSQWLKHNSKIFYQTAHNYPSFQISDGYQAMTQVQLRSRRLSMNNTT